MGIKFLYYAVFLSILRLVNIYDIEERGDLYESGGTIIGLSGRIL